jgi:hypothetical protein
MSLDRQTLKIALFSRCHKVLDAEPGRRPMSLFWLSLSPARPLLFIKYMFNDIYGKTQIVSLFFPYRHIKIAFEAGGQLMGKSQLHIPVAQRTGDYPAGPSAISSSVDTVIIGHLRNRA